MNRGNSGVAGIEVFDAVRDMLWSLTCFGLSEVERILR
jgi:hypothetical protein